MDYRAYKIETVIDWVELEIQTVDGSNFWTIQRHLKKALLLSEQEKRPGVDPEGATDTGSASIFRFRIQAPKNMHQLNEVLSRLRKRFNIETVRVVGIEVALDTYRPGANKKELAEIVADRYRFLTAKPSKHWHLYRHTGETPVTVGRATRLGKLDNAERLCDLVRHLENEWQLTDCEGKDNPEIRYHGYVKAWDNGEPLNDASQWRARWEVTLRGQKLPFKTLQELAAFNFTKLAKHFNFCRLADDLPHIIRHPLATWSVAQLGMKGKYKRANRSMVGRLYNGFREYRRAMVADEINKVISDSCLRRLTRQWRHPE